MNNSIKCGFKGLGTDTDNVCFCNFPNHKMQNGWNHWVWFKTMCLMCCSNSVGLTLICNKKKSNNFTSRINPKKLGQAKTNVKGLKLEIAPLTLTHRPTVAEKIWCGACAKITSCQSSNKHCIVKKRSFSLRSCSGTHLGVFSQMLIRFD